MILPTSKPVVPVVKATGKRLYIFQHWNSAIPTMGLAFLWVPYGTSITQLQSRSPHQALPSSSTSATWSVRRAHTLACDKEWGKREDHLHSLFYGLDILVTKSIPPRTEFSSYLSRFLFLPQAEGEVDAHLRHRHLCRTNIVIARGQRSCFVSPFALLPTHPAQWDRQEAVEDSGPVIEIW